MGGWGQLRRELVIAVLGAAVITLAVITMSKGTAIAVVSAVIAGCVALLGWDNFLRERMTDRRERKSGAKVERLRVTRTHTDGSTTDVWSDGRRDVEIRPRAAGDISITGAARGTWHMPSRWERMVRWLRNRLRT